MGGSLTLPRSTTERPASARRSVHRFAHEYEDGAARVPGSAGSGRQTSNGTRLQQRQGATARASPMPKPSLFGPEPGKVRRRSRARRSNLLLADARRTGLPTAPPQHQVMTW